MPPADEKTTLSGRVGPRMTGEERSRLWRRRRLHVTRPKRNNHTSYGYKIDDNALRAFPLSLLLFIIMLLL